MTEAIKDRAPFWHRAAAYLLDRIILLLPQLLLFIPAIFGGALWSTAVFFNYSLLSIVFWLLRTAYFALFTFFAGATPGKRAMKLRVVTAEGAPLTFLNALYRESVGRYLSGILFIGYIMAAADPEKRALHDMICDTRVICVPTQPAPAAPVRQLSVLETEDAEKDWYKPYRV